MYSDNTHLDKIDVSGREAMSDDLVYPALELEGITMKEELDFYAERNNGKNSIPLFIRFNGILKRFNSIEISMESFQIMKKLGYKITLHKQSGIDVPIDLDDPLTFVNLIRL